MVPFETFWSRLKEEFCRLPSRGGAHFGKIRKWSQKRGYLLEGEFVFLYRGGNIIDCKTATTDDLRLVSTAEVKKVYQVWSRYCSGSILRTTIVHELGVQNASWIIPILKHYEHLMK